MAENSASPTVVAGFLTAVTSSVFGQGLDQAITPAMRDFSAPISAVTNTAESLTSAIDPNVASVLGGMVPAKGISQIFNQLAPLPPDIGAAINTPTLNSISPEISQALSGTNGISNVIGGALDATVPALSGVLGGATSITPAIRPNGLGR